MINILLSGCLGKMGQVITTVAADSGDCCISCGYDIGQISGQVEYPVYRDLSRITEKIDVIIDFSHPSSLDGVLAFAVKTKTPAVICTTGLSTEQVNLIEDAAVKIPVFYSANMSIGISLIIDLARRAAKTLGDGFDIEIIEKHHNQKVDAPSGTALAIANAISRDGDNKYVYTYQ
jgi:4-hydroxy-tetrahydrodipicolinate reductase